MNGDKIQTFMQLAGQDVAGQLNSGSVEKRKLGAQLLLSEVLEYVINGLGITPEVNGVKIEEPDNVKYSSDGREVDHLEMLDGLADVAYTMYWNSIAFGIPLEESFELVCDNNLEKFVELNSWQKGEGSLTQEQWHCEKDISWPQEVTAVSVININDRFFAVGKDNNGKVRKPSHYKSVDLRPLLP